MNVARVGVSVGGVEGGGVRLTKISDVTGADAAFNSGARPQLSSIVLKVANSSYVLFWLV